jgi:hypothetical protein
VGVLGALEVGCGGPVGGIVGLAGQRARAEDVVEAVRFTD